MEDFAAIQFDIALSIMRNHKWIAEMPERYFTRSAFTTDADIAGFAADHAKKRDEWQANAISWASR